MARYPDIPHRDDELEKLTLEEIRAALQHARMMAKLATSSKIAKLWHKRAHWFEAAIDQRE